MSCQHRWTWFPFASYAPTAWSYNEEAGMTPEEKEVIDAAVEFPYSISMSDRMLKARSALIESRKPKPRYYLIGNSVQDRRGPTVATVYSKDDAQRIADLLNEHGL